MKLRFIVSFLLVWLSGCTTNISGDPRYDTGYREGRIYALTQNLHGLVFRGSIIRDLRNITILPPKEYAKCIAQNEEARTMKRTTLLPLPHINELVDLPKGTLVRVTKVMLTHDVENGTQMNLSAEFASGPYKGKTAVLREISQHRPLKQGGIFSMLVRDPAYLEELKAPNKTPEPTTTSGTSAAEQPLVPAAVVAHL